MDRRPAQRVFARELTDATFEFKLSDDADAPQFVLLPTGAPAHRVLIAGALVETAPLGPNDFHMGRVIDETTAAVRVVAGQYNEDALADLQALSPPEHVVALGRTDTYVSAKHDGRHVSVQLERIRAVDHPRRDEWTLDAALQTFERLDAFDTTTNGYAGLATEQYPDLSLATYRDAAVEALDSAGLTDELPGATPDPAATLPSAHAES
jgi:RPA family protein